MKQLKDILYNTRLLNVIGSTSIGIRDITSDSRKVEPGGAFIAISGTQTDGHQYIDIAIENGASAIICENLPHEHKNDISYVVVENSAASLGVIASNFYNNPSHQLSLIGVTGTNGKTTIATLLYELFTKLGFVSGLISTVENKIDQQVVKTSMTTPDAITLNKLLQNMVEAGCQYCFMEVSSHAIDQHRIDGLVFKGGIFTNLTHDHLDYHKTFKAYLQAKQQFFNGLSPKAFALTNIDDKNGEIMLQNCRAKKYSYSLKTLADFSCNILENQFEGLLLKINGTELWSQLVGEYNAYNLTAVAGAAILSDLPATEAYKGISSLMPVNGRFDILRNNQNITVIVDYAHTPDALHNVLATIAKIRTGNEQLITVVGAGGNRDKTKRPLMAQIAASNSNTVILTSDNPRNEDPEQIIKEMLNGLDPVQKKKVLTITNRKEAIKTACMMAKPNDLILVAGKGHETYQEINGIRHHFDDKEHITDFLDIKA